MLYSLLADASNKFREVGFGEASLYALLGFLIVFLGISFLILIIWAVGKVMNRGSKPSTKSKEPPAEKIEENKPTAPSEEISEETVAVIMAALMAYYQQNNPKCEFTVKRIKRI